MKRSLIIVALPILAAASAAQASISITRGSSAPGYASTLNFDEVGGATGLNVPANAFASRGVSSLISGEGSNSVRDHAALFGLPGLGTANSFYAPFGVFLNLTNDATAMSFQYWDESGPFTGFGGGAAIFVFSNGGADPVATFEISSPVWGGNTNSWFNIVATGASTFDEVRMVGFGFNANAVTDNISFVPAPGSLALLGLGGAAALRRRR